MEKNKDIMELLDRLNVAIDKLANDMEKYNDKLNEGVEHAIDKSITIKTNLGHIYIGDICYALDNTIYDKFWGNEHDYRDGVYTFEGIKFGVYGTAYGDGCYYGSDNRAYGVDAGVIGVVPMELWGKDKTIEELNRLGRVVEISQVDFRATGRKGTEQDGIFYITIGDEELIINTYKDDDYEW